MQFCSYWLQCYLPEAVGDGGILFYIHRKVQKVLIFAAYLNRNEDIKKVSLINLEYYCNV